MNSELKWTVCSMYEELRMQPDQLTTRITTDPNIFDGKPIVRGMRVSVELILSLLEQKASFAEILSDYPDLCEEDIQACLAYRPYKGRRIISISERMQMDPPLPPETEWTQEGTGD